MQTRTIVDKIELEPQSGVVGIRMRKQIVNGEKVMSEQYHRTTVAPGADVDTQMALVNAHLVADGYPPVQEGDMTRINSAVSSFRGV